MKKIYITRLWKICLFLFLFLIIYNSYSDTSISKFYTSNLRIVNFSTYEFVKFRNLSNLSHICEQMTTIDCLNYLQYNQSDYLQSLSLNEYNSFQNQYCTKKNKMLFHTFWNNPNKLNDPLLLLHIQSHLYTQNRQCSYLIIWTLPLLSGEIDSRYNAHEPYLQFRTLLPLTKEFRAVGVNIDSYWTWLFGTPLFVRPALVSDAVRFIVLHKFGGMYIDVDILLLRDLQPFYMHEFAYRWSTHNEFNTAVLRLHSQSLISSILIKLAQDNHNPLIFFPTSIRSYLYPIILKRLPCVFFDPLWLVADGADPQAAQIWKLTNDVQNTFETVFRKQNELSRRGRTVLNGAYAFHWHALHRAGKFEQGSYLYQWNEFLENQLLENI